MKKRIALGQGFGSANLRETASELTLNEQAGNHLSHGGTALQAVGLGWQWT